MSIKFQEIVLGYSMDAYLYAFCNQIPILDSSGREWVHDPTEVLGVGFEFEGLRSEVVILNTNLGPITEGSLHKEIFKNFLKYCMGLNGMLLNNSVPFLFNKEMINITLDVRTKNFVISKKKRQHNIYFEKIHLFEQGVVSESLYTKKVDNKVKFIDYYTCDYNFNRGGVHIDSYYCMHDDNVISEVHFSKSATNNVIVVSDFELEDIKDPNYGNSIVMMATRQIMQKDLGTSFYLNKTHEYERKIRYIEYDKKENYDFVILHDSYSIEHINNLKSDNINLIKAKQSFIHDQEECTLLENIGHKIYKRIAFKRKKEFSD